MPITRRKRANPPDQPENNNHLAEQSEGAAEALAAEQEQAPAAPAEQEQAQAPTGERVESPAFPPIAPSPTPPPAVSIGDRGERQEYAPVIEGGRRTPRGEFFRRPPQPPPPNQVPPAFASSSPPPAPTHEIMLPLGNLLHLAYNPSYTGADEARGILLQRLTDESKAGGRARCWNCGSLAIAYDRWNTKSKTFGEIGIALCEICGAWSVL
ncbi:MAG: hypothetical protein H0W02_15805 [Ktedonobacteraceae bacterium]|nr:hypothetical protein [Ktedonobacteraceae bacterium]